MGVYSLVFFNVVLCCLFCLVKVSNVDALGEGKKLEPYILVSPRRRKEAIPHLTKRSLPYCHTVVFLLCKYSEYIPRSIQTSLLLYVLYRCRAISTLPTFQKTDLECLVKRRRRM
jgi:hypothetical protein